MKEESKRVNEKEKSCEWGDREMLNVHLISCYRTQPKNIEISETLQISSIGSGQSPQKSAKKIAETLAKGFSNKQGSIFQLIQSRL